LVKSVSNFSGVSASRSSCFAIAKRMVLTYPAVGSPPSYVSPPVDPARVIMDNIAKAERSLIDLAKLQDRRSSSAEKSGIAHKYEFHESNSSFAKIAANMEDAERKIIRLFYQWQKKPGGSEVSVPVSVEYPRDFNSRPWARRSKRPCRRSRSTSVPRSRPN
jgi:hypothetical protein